MQRRHFLTLLGGAAAAWPIAARAQQPTMPMIGLPDSGSAAERLLQVTAFRDGLKEAGFIEGAAGLQVVRQLDLSLRIARSDNTP